ncbi:hemolysin family protein [Pseudothermotoga thermarum]|uniref:CBS domain containing protein n=1 Tax=Pseudothermotoga thermarum DSM 5069 TaxID=688269 RepID=F7YYM9_9THEM|nr:hemolysin family protein [Pseudothermotoga thermarum]AEH51061.1 CBS domain containing protein [Pseudothermotoga thermarum DSM 5069]
MEDPLSSSYDLLLRFLAMVVLLILSAFISASETALTSISKLKLLRKEEKDKILKVNRLLTAILVSNNFVNLMLSSITTVLFIKLLSGLKEGIVVLLSTLFVTIVLLIFGEITPKIYAREYAEKVYEKSVKFISLIERLLSPLIMVLLFISNKLVQLFGGQAMESTPFITSDDIVAAVNIGKGDGTIGHQEGLIVERTFEMSETTIKEIMTPRVDVVAIEENASLQELMELVEKEGYSRIPVYRGDIDNIVGVCYVKDVVTLLAKPSEENLLNKKVKEIMREPIFVPETMKVSTLLKIFKEKKVHLAIVVDEFGGTAGIVTLEDILEELVGEIMDEYDYDEVNEIKKISENTYLVKATIPINDLERELDVELPETEHETLAGFLLEFFQRIPSVGEEITVGKFHFKIVAATKNRIERVLITVKGVDENKAKK